MAHGSTPTMSGYTTNATIRPRRKAIHRGIQFRRDCFPLASSAVLTAFISEKSPNLWLLTSFPNRSLRTRKGVEISDAFRTYRSDCRNASTSASSRGLNCTSNPCGMIDVLPGSIVSIIDRASRTSARSAFTRYKASTVSRPMIPL